jgi:hypothetical protein
MISVIQNTKEKQMDNKERAFNTNVARGEAVCPLASLGSCMLHR